ncbi:MAG: helicase-related protein [Acidimicrobiia bacterium]
MSIIEDPLLDDTPLENLRVPIEKNGQTVRVPLKPAQVDGIRRLNSRAHPVFRDRPKGKSLVHSAVGTRKTIMAAHPAITQFQKTGQPIFFTADAITLMDNWEQQFIPLFRQAVGRDPIIHRHGENGHIDDGEPDLVMATPQFISTYLTFEGRDHELMQREYCVGVADESDLYATKNRVEILERMHVGHLIGITGTKDRRDDPEVGHRVEEVFGKPVFEYSTEDAIASGEINRPDYVLYASNIYPILHHVLKGKVKLHEINDVYTSKELNSEYLRIFRENYEELDHPQTIFYCKTKEHAKQIEEALRAEGFDPIPVHTGVDAKTRKNNIEEFRRRKNGGIVVAVNMLRRGVNFHDLGLIVETAESRSASRFFQTLGRAVRGQNVRFVDITTNFAQIQHIRLFAQRLKKAYRRFNREQYESNDVDLTGVSIHKSTDRLTSDLIKLGIISDQSEIDQNVNFDVLLERSGLKDKFFFALRAHAAAVWETRDEKSKRDFKVKLKNGSVITLDNGIKVTLQEDETVNVKHLFKNLIKDEHGNFIVTDEQQKLLQSLEINLEELEYSLKNIHRPSNIPRTGLRESTYRKLEREASKFFNSQDFKDGLVIYRELSTAVTPFDLQYTDLVFSTDKSKLGKWNRQVKKLIDHAPFELQLQLLESSYLANKSLLHEVILREFRALEKNAPSISHYGETSLSNDGQVWNMHNQHPGSLTIKAGSQFHISSNRLITLPSDLTFSYVEALKVEARFPTSDYFTAVGYGTSKAHAKAPNDVSATFFIKSDYFYLGLAANNLGNAGDKNLIIPHGTIISRSTFGVTSTSDDSFRVPTDISFNLSNFYDELLHHLQFVDTATKDLILNAFGVIKPTEISTSFNQNMRENTERQTQFTQQLNRNNFQAERFMLKAWLDTRPESLDVDAIPDEFVTSRRLSYREKKNPSIALTTAKRLDPRLALEHCQYLAYRTLMLNNLKLPHEQDSKLNDLYNDLIDCGWDWKWIKSQFRIDPHLLDRDNVAQDFSGKKILEIIPEDRLKEFFLGMLEINTSKDSIGYPGFLPQIDEQISYDEYEFHLLLRLKALEICNAEHALTMFGFEPNNSRPQSFIPAGTEFTFSNGVSVHLTSDTLIARAWFENMIDEFRFSAQYPGINDFENHIWAEMDRVGREILDLPEVMLGFSLYTFEKWIDSNPDNYGTTSEPEKFIIPAGTKIKLDNGRTHTLLIPYMCENALDSCRKLAISYLVNQSESVAAFNDQYNLNVDLRDFELYGIGIDLSIEEDWEKAKSLESFAQRIIDLIPEGKLEEFLGATEKRPTQCDGLSYNANFSEALENFEHACLEIRPSKITKGLVQITKGSANIDFARQL